MDAFMESLLSAKFLYCTICKEILKTPVWLTSDKTNLCNTCYHDNREQFESVIKDPALAKVLEKLDFPCKNKEEGCTRVLKYEHYQKHLSRCRYGHSCLIPMCRWGGLESKLIWHLCEDHPELTLQKQGGSFLIDCSQLNSDMMNLVETPNGQAIIRTRRNRDTFQIMIHCLEHYGLGGGDFTLVYPVDAQAMVHRKCRVARDLNDLRTFNPAYVTQAEIKDGLNVSSVQLIYKSDDSTPMIPRWLLRFYKCYECQKYLHAIILGCAQWHPICNSCLRLTDHRCFEGQQLVTLTKILEERLSTGIAAEYLFPCQFEEHGCKFQGPLQRHHEQVCHFKPIKCVVDGCPFTYQYSRLVTHLIEDHEDSCTSDNTRHFVQPRGHDNLEFFFIYYDNLFLLSFNSCSLKSSAGSNRDMGIYSYGWTFKRLCVDAMPEANSEEFLFTVVIPTKRTRTSITKVCGSTIDLKARNMLNNKGELEFAVTVAKKDSLNERKRSHSVV